MSLAGHRPPRTALVTRLAIAGILAFRLTDVTAIQTKAASPQRLDLSQLAAAGKLRSSNREVTSLPARAGAVHVSANDGPGVAWIDGTEFSLGTIEIELRGKDVVQQSFLGIAFHGKDDKTYESVYLRPFNFRAEDPVRHGHAVQYMALPDFDWPVLRQKFPEEFERPVDKSIAPTDWVTLRVVVTAKAVQAYVGAVKEPTFEVRKLGESETGLVGLWVGNTSDGDFANLRITK